MASNLPEGTPSQPEPPPTPNVLPELGGDAFDAPVQRGGLDRRAVERVLARAAELQGISGGERDVDAIAEDRLLEIAREAGLSVTSVRQALAEERTRIPAADEDSRWLQRVTGPAIVSASRSIAGEPEAMIYALDTRMQRDECLQVQRRFSDRVVWEPRTDWFGAIKRGLRIGGRSYQLARTRQVAATVVPVDENRSLVRLDADVTPSRSTLIRVSGAVGASGLIAGGAAFTLGAVAHVAAAFVLFSAAAPVAIAGTGAYLILRRHHDFAQRTMLALEQVLDSLQYGDVRRRPGLLDSLASPRALYGDRS